jgi:hypothetical protein
MMEGYYRPNIEDFKEGFEYEEFWNDKPTTFPNGYWKKKVFRSEGSCVNQYRIDRGDFRVPNEVPWTGYSGYCAVCSQRRIISNGFCEKCDKEYTWGKKSSRKNAIWIPVLKSTIK